jgi:DNA-binding GntR family transcriptional regulator
MIMSRKADTKSLIDEAYRSIKRLMLQQKLFPGQKLLYRELIERLGMSKTPIVNALNRLEQEGFVIAEPNVGYTVKPIDVKEIFDSYEVREALEVKSVSQALKKGKPKQMAALEDKLAIFEQYRPYKYDKKKLMLDCDFHLQIAVMSGNDVLRYLLRRNFEHIILRTKLDNYDPKRMDATAEDHRRLLVSMKKKDVPTCVDRIENHIRHSRDYVIRCLSKEEQEGIESIPFFENVEG